MRLERDDKGPISSMLGLQPGNGIVDGSRPERDALIPRLAPYDLDPFAVDRLGCNLRTWAAGYLELPRERTVGFGSRIEL